MSNNNIYLNSEVQESHYNKIQNELSSKVNDELTEALQSGTKTDSLNSSLTYSEETQIPATPGSCRICLQSDMDESNKCITPCFCRGSISKVHRKCLETWLAQARSTNCEICKFEFKTKWIAKYSLLGSIKAWLISDETREDVKDLLFDGCLLLLTGPIMLLLSYSGFYITDHVFNEGTPVFDTSYQIISFLACTTIMCADFFFGFWTSCRIQQHFSRWFDFYKHNQQVSIIDQSLQDKDSEGA